MSDCMSECIKMVQIYFVFWNGYFVWFIDCDYNFHFADLII
jgi:hypothetical protein